MIEISVVMPAYNSEKTIADSIESIINQSYKNFELIVVDDGSTDSTFNIIEHYQREFKNIVCIKQKNQGQASARNNAIAISNGRYIAFLDSDDISSPLRLKEQYDYLQDNLDISILGAARIDISDSGEYLGAIYPRTLDVELKKHILIECPFFTSTVMCRREIFNNYSFQVNAVPCEDHDLWIRISEGNNIKFHNLRTVNVIYKRRKYISNFHAIQMCRMIKRHYQRLNKIYIFQYLFYRPYISYLMRIAII